MIRVHAGLRPLPNAMGGAYNHILSLAMMSEAAAVEVPVVQERESGSTSAAGASKEAEDGEGVTLATGEEDGEGVTLATGEEGGEGVILATGEEGGEGVTLATGEEDGEGVVKGKGETCDGVIGGGGEAGDSATVEGGGSVESEEIQERPQGMSKNQWKKLLRHQRWEAGREQRRQKRKEKERDKRKKRKLDIPLEGPLRKKKRLHSDSVSPYRVAIELGYEHLMGDRDIKMLVKQCQRCYSENRKACNPLQIFLTGFGGRCKQRLDSAITGYRKWDVHFCSGNYFEEFGQDNIVFLAAESPNVLTDLDPAKVYVIGGLVDHNHHKGYCFKDAMEKGVAHAQLPISDFVKLNSRKVLAVNHVFEILLSFVQTKDWKKAFYSTIPQRKLVVDTTEEQKEKCEIPELGSILPEDCKHSSEDHVL